MAARQRQQRRVRIKAPATGTHLRRTVRGNVRLFAFYVANGTLLASHPDIDIADLDYAPLLARHDDALGQLFAIYLNVLRVGEDGDLLPPATASAQQRASQWLRHACDLGYRIAPPLHAEDLSLDAADRPWKQAIKDFARVLGRGALAPAILHGIDYVSLFTDAGSWLEGIFALYCNVLRLDHAGRPLNAPWATRRAAMLVRRYIDPAYAPRPPLRAWEVALW